MEPGTRSEHKSGPVHPPITHFPIALWVTAFLFDVASIWMGNAMVRAAFYNVAAGFVFAILAAVTGFADYNKIPEANPGKRLAIIHGLANAAIVMLYAVDTWMRSLVLDASRTPSAPFVLGAIGVVGLLFTGLLGHRIVFDYGANVVARPADRRTTGDVAAAFRPRTPVGP